MGLWVSVGLVVCGLSLMPSLASVGTPIYQGTIQAEVATDQQTLLYRTQKRRIRFLDRDLSWIMAAGIRAPAGVISVDLGLGDFLVKRPVFALWSDVRLGPRIAYRDFLLFGGGARMSLLPGWMPGRFRFFLGPELDMGIMKAPLRGVEYRISPLATGRAGVAIDKFEIWLMGAAGYSFGGNDTGSI